MPSPTSMTVPTFVVRTGASACSIWSRSARTMSSDRIPIAVASLIHSVAQPFQPGAHAVIADHVFLLHDEATQDLWVDPLGDLRLAAPSGEPLRQASPLLVGQRRSRGDDEVLDAERAV